MVISEIDAILGKVMQSRLSDFAHIPYNENHNVGFFIRHLENRQQVISYGYHGYSHREITEASIGMYDVNGWITFYAVNDILVKFPENGEKEVNKTFRLSTERTIINHPDMAKRTTSSDRVQLFRNGRILVENVATAADALMAGITHNLLPLFERVNSLKLVNEEIIKEIPQLKLSSYLYGPDVPLIKLIVMKLSGDQGYDDYRLWLDGNFQLLIVSDPDFYKKQYEVFKSISQYLESVKSGDL